MTETPGHTILDRDSNIGVLHLGPPDGSSTYAFIVKQQHNYVVWSWINLGANYQDLLANREQLRRHRNGLPLVVDVSNVGQQFVQYLHQTGIEGCIPVVSLDNAGEEPRTFQSSDFSYLSLSEVGRKSQV